MHGLLQVITWPDVLATACKILDTVSAFMRSDISQAEPCFTNHNATPRVSLSTRPPAHPTVDCGSVRGCEGSR